MRKFLFATLAICVFTGLFAVAALAEETLLAVWLTQGQPVVTLSSTTTTGRFTLEDTKTIAGAAAVLCAVTEDGSVGPNGEGEITEILNVSAEPVGELGGLALLGTGAASGVGSECKTVKTCAEGTAASPIEVWPVSDVLHIIVFLDFLGIIRRLEFSLKETLGYELLCLVLGINTEDTCTSAANKFTVEVINDPENVAIPAGAEEKPLALCSQSGEETGKIIADELTPILLLEGSLSTASE
jgi:hypothetical protein